MNFPETRWLRSLQLSVAAGALLFACGQKVEQLSSATAAVSLAAGGVGPLRAGAAPAASSPARLSRIGCPTSRALSRARTGLGGATGQPGAIGQSEAACPTLTLSTPPRTWKGSLIEVSPLDRFCGYRLESASGPQLVDDDSLDALEAKLTSDDPSLPVELACPIVVPLQDPSSAMSEATSRRVLKARVALVKNYFDGFPPSSKQKVRVAVVDTAAVDYDRYDASGTMPGCSADACVDRHPHGRAVGRVIASLLCGETAACPAIKNYLALPVVSSQTDERDMLRGGTTGTQEDLATAIKLATADWLASNKATLSPLVINLSVGWHAIHNRLTSAHLREAKPDGFYLFSERPSVGASLVRAALQSARCAGALIVAAAGNAIGHDRLMPMYPAGWETEPALSKGQCEERKFRTDPTQALPFEAAPLVYAVTAVDEFGSPLGNTRAAPPARYQLPGGLAERAALGYAVATSDPHSVGGFTPIYSGTSMAAAVVSGFAARSWSAALERRSARQVMAELPYSDCGVHDPGEALAPIERSTCASNAAPVTIAARPVIGSSAGR